MKRVNISSNNVTKAYVGMSVTTLIIGLSFVFVKIALEYSSPLDVLAYRFTIAALALIVLQLFGIAKCPHISRRQFFRLIVLSAFYPLLFFLLQAEGLQRTSASEAGILSALTPILTMLVTMSVLREKNSKYQIMGVTISLIGVGYIFVMNGISISSDHLWGNILILMSILSTVLYYIMGHRVLRDYRTMDVSYVMIIVGCLFFNLLAITIHVLDGTLGEFWDPMQSRDFWISVLYLGVLSSLATSIFNNYALSRLPASQLAVFNNLSPVISMIGGVWILGEQLECYHYIGAFLVIFGVIITNLFRRQQ